jgi:hypothetical protein
MVMKKKKILKVHSFIRGMPFVINMNRISVISNLNYRCPPKIRVRSMLFCIFFLQFFHAHIVGPLINGPGTASKPF